MKHYRVAKVNRYVVLESGDGKFVHEVSQPCTLKEANRIAEAFFRANPGSTVDLGGNEPSIGMCHEHYVREDGAVVHTPPCRHVVHSSEDSPYVGGEQLVAVEISRLQKP